MAQELPDIKVGQVWETKNGTKVKIIRVDNRFTYEHGATGIAAFPWKGRYDSWEAEVVVWCGGKFHGTAGADYDYNLVKLISPLPSKQKQLQLL